MTSPVPDAVPVLPVADLVRAVAFYERLGFLVRAGYPGYCILGFGSTEVHLAEMPEVAGHESASGVYLRVPDADEVHSRWTAMGAVELSPPTDQPYGIREFATEDLDGNLWRVGSPIEARTETPIETPTETAVGEPDEGLDEGLDADVPVDGSAGTTDASWFAIVSSRRCEGCGLVATELPARALGAEVRDVVHTLAALLQAADDSEVRQRPSPGSWSALEYGVHVRDLLVVFAERIIRTLAEDHPDLGWWDPEAAIADTMANEADVTAVADDLGRNASKLSEALRMVDDEAWERTAVRRGGDQFTIELMARFTLHEVVHHKVDAASALAAAARSRGTTAPEASGDG